MALQDLGQIRLGINHPTIPIETQQRPAFVALAGDDVFSRQHGRRKAPVLMEVQRQNQIVTAGAGNTIDIAIACQMQRADALVRMKPHHRSAKARQAIDLLQSSYNGSILMVFSGNESLRRTAVFIK
jgi:hypothetical protein